MAGVEVRGFGGWLKTLSPAREFGFKEVLRRRQHVVNKKMFPPTFPKAETESTTP